MVIGPTTARGGVGEPLQPLLQAQAVAGADHERALQPLEVASGRALRGFGVLPDGSPPQPAQPVVEGGTQRGRMASSRASATSLPRVPASPAGPTQEGQPSRQGQAAISVRLSASSRGCSR